MFGRGSAADAPVADDEENGMIDHIGLRVRDVARSTEFYLEALAPLGLGIVMEVSAEETGHGAAVGFGAPGAPEDFQSGKPSFWIGAGEPLSGPLHVAFVAFSRAAVDAFFAAAVKAGGKDNGAPGLRPHYHANYYAAFVLDPDGNNIEAVCHAPA
jgi:catechol 2,3-dioxygenase-like lactoylglutathione lyase family enzyme